MHGRKLPSAAVGHAELQMRSPAISSRMVIGNVTLSEVSMLTLLHGSLSELYFGLSVLRECRVCCDLRADKRL